jgi:hypothetical protein
MKAGNTIYVVRFTSAGVSEIPGQKYSSVSNVYAIIGNKKTDIDKVVEWYRIQEESAVQKHNTCKVITKAKVVNKINVVNLLKS